MHTENMQVCAERVSIKPCFSNQYQATEIDERSGRYLNPDLHDYYTPVCADIDQVYVEMLSETDRDVNPAGVKGLGEIGIAGTNAAISNTLYHATGKRLRNTPMRLEGLLS